MPTSLSALLQHVRWLLAVRSVPEEEPAAPPDPTVALPPDVRWAVLHALRELHPAAIDVRTLRVDAAVEAADVPARALEGIERWEIAPGEDALREGLRSPDPPICTSPLEEFYADYPALRPSADTRGSADEHYAERIFLEQVFYPVLGPAGLRRLVPQETFEDERGSRRRIDFVLIGARKYAIEIEGRTYHDRGEGFDAETLRRRSLTAAGYSYIPYTFDDLRSGRSGQAAKSFGELCDDDPELAVLAVHRRPVGAEPGGEAPEATRRDLTFWRLLRWLPEAFQETQL